MPRDDRQQVILLATLFCGVVGGLLAFGLYGGVWKVGWWQAVLALMAGTGVGTGLAFYVLTAEPGKRTAQMPPSRHRTVRPASPAGPSGAGGAGYGTVQPQRHRVPAGHSAVPHAQQPTEPEPAKMVLPLAGADAAGSLPRPWWNERQAAGAVPPATAAGAAPGTGRADHREPSPGRRQPAPPLSSYDAAAALIAQCPRCGEFKLDVSTVSPGYAFRCTGCGNRWEWTPGTPWPTVVVRRNLDSRSMTEVEGTEQREPWK